MRFKGKWQVRYSHVPRQHTNTHLHAVCMCARQLVRAFVTDTGGLGASAPGVGGLKEELTRYLASFSGRGDARERDIDISRRTGI